MVYVIIAPEHQYTVTKQISVNNEDPMDEWCRPELPSRRLLLRLWVIPIETGAHFTLCNFVITIVRNTRYSKT